MLTTITAALQLAVTPQPTAPVQTVFHGRQNQTVVSIQKQNLPVKIDGVLDDGAWKGAVMLTGFSQFDPVDGLPAADSTEVYVTYTDHEIYFAVRAFEPHGAVNAKLADRDKIFGGDYIDIMLDTFNDRRRAYEFVSNPFGVQADGVFSESPQISEDFTPDFLFQTKGRLTDFGYEIEMRIPFKSIGYQPKDVQDWGIQIVRRVQHSGQNQTWTPARQGTTSLLSQNGTLKGLSQLKRGLVLDVNPVVTAHLEGRPVAGGFRYGSAEPEVGGNVRWGLTTNLTLNATVNPDFSQIESDASQVVFDPRQALFFPEKRPFFLENSEQLSAPSRLIYTRRIVSPAGAVKFTGKIGSTNIGYLSAVDDASLSASGDNHPIYNILRLKRDVGQQNTIGLVYTDRVLAGDYNRVIGVDTRVTFRKEYSLFAQYAQSIWQQGSADANVPLYVFALSRNGRKFGWNLNFDAVHDEFVAGSGFVTRPGIARSNTGLRFTMFGKKEDFIQAYTFNPLVDNTWDYQELVRGIGPDDIKLHFNNNFILRGGWRFAATFYLESFRYPAKLYTNYYTLHKNAAGDSSFVPYVGVNRIRNYDFSISLNTPQFPKWSLSTFIIAGRDENFDEWSPGYIMLSHSNLSFRPTEKIRADLSYVDQRTYRPSDHSAVNLQRIPRLKLEYQLSRPVFIRFVGQYVSFERAALIDDSRTGDPIYFRSDNIYRRAAAVSRNNLRADFLFSYQPAPGTVLFAGYGSSLRDAEPFSFNNVNRTSDGFFIKLSYLFRM